MARKKELNDDLTPKAKKKPAAPPDNNLMPQVKVSEEQPTKENKSKMPTVEKFIQDTPSPKEIFEKAFSEGKSNPFTNAPAIRIKRPADLIYERYARASDLVQNIIYEFERAVIEQILELPEESILEFAIESDGQVAEDISGTVVDMLIKAGWDLSYTDGVITVKLPEIPILSGAYKVTLTPRPGL